MVTGNLKSQWLITADLFLKHAACLQGSSAHDHSRTQILETPLSHGYHREKKENMVNHELALKISIGNDHSVLAIINKVSP